MTHFVSQRSSRQSNDLCGVGECCKSRQDESGACCLVIGLGGGGLPVFLHRHLQIPTRVIELDKEVAKLARDHFGCHACPGLQVIASAFETAK